MNKLVIVAFAVLALLAASAGARANVDSATQLYVDTVAAMQALPQPPFVTYRLVTESDTGLQVSLEVHDHDVWLHFAPGKRVTTWSVAHRASDFRSLIVSDSGNDYVTNRAFFDPTWYSAYHAMRTGMFFDAPSHTQPDQRAVPTPAPTFTPDSTLTTIAQTAAAVSTLYTARFRGVGKCPNGDPGRVLEFTPSGPAMQYQLTGAVVDVPAHLFCVMIFTLPSLDGTPLTDVQFYGERGGYWLRTGGEFIRTTSRVVTSPQIADISPPDVPGAAPQGVAGIPPPNISSTVRTTATLRYQLTKMAFPQIVPEDFFVPPPGQ